MAFLEAHVGHLGGGGSAYVLGDALHGLQWHIYVAARTAGPRARCQGEHSIEVCMTDLCPMKVKLLPWQQPPIVRQQIQCLERRLMTFTEDCLLFIPLLDISQVLMMSMQCCA